MKRLLPTFANTFLTVIAAIALIFTSCGKSSVDDPTPKPSFTSSDKAEMLSAAATASSIVITFKANGDWQATSSNEACARITSGSSGAAGKATIAIAIQANSGDDRSAEIIISAKGCEQKRLCKISQEGTSSAAVTEAVKSMDKYLASSYLWNTEYKTLNLVAAKKLPYDQFLESALMSMTTNTFDKKSDGDGGYRIYSYVTRTPLAGTQQASTRADIPRPNHGVTAEKLFSFGIASLMLAYIDQNKVNIGIVIEAVYPNSPATTAGINRGSIITSIGGTTITTANYGQYLNEIYYDVTGTKTLKMADSFAKKEYTVTSAKIDETPVIKSEVISVGTHKIGYIVYSGFQAAYDGEMLMAFKKLKEGGATDIILDLRINGGGHVISADMISCCIAGSECQGKVFQYYRYNDDRMADVEATKKTTQMAYDSNKKLFYENFAYPTYFGINLETYALKLNRVYCITSSGTASASEAVINGLRGLGLTVKTIGTRSNGKNVGMEPIKFDSEGYRYEFAPITFQGYNSKVESVDPTGITPTIAAAEWNNGLGDFNKDEVCVAKAIADITGVAAPARTRTTATPLVKFSGSLRNPHAAEGNILLPHTTLE